MGGPNKVLLNMVLGLSKKDAHIKIITLFNSSDNPYLEYYLNNGIEVISLNLKNKIDVIIHGLKKLKPLLNKDDCVIHSHGILPDFLNSRLDNKFNKITTIHNRIKEDYMAEFGHIKGYIFFLWHLVILNNIKHIVCCSKSSYDFLKKYKNCCYIENGIGSVIDPKQIEKNMTIRDELGIKKDDLVYIFCGAFVKIKRPEQLLNAFNNCSAENEHLILLGDGPLYKKCLNYQRKNVHFLGFKKNVEDYLLASDVYISNSASEGFSISVIEALEKGLYLFLSDIPSHREVFEIDKKFYVGEIFNSNNFAKQKKKLVFNMQKNDAVDIIKFKNNYLTNEVMMAKYYQYYLK